MRAVFTHIIHPVFKPVQSAIRQSAWTHAEVEKLSRVVQFVVHCILWLVVEITVAEIVPLSQTFVVSCYMPQIDLLLSSRLCLYVFILRASFLLWQAEQISRRKCRNFADMWRAYISSVVVYVNTWYTLCSEKNTHLCFLLYLRGNCLDLHKIFRVCLWGIKYSADIKIKYSLLPVT